MIGAVKGAGTKECDLALWLPPRLLAFGDLALVGVR